MANDSAPLTPQERIALTRQALLRQMGVRPENGSSSTQASHDGHTRESVGLEDDFENDAHDGTYAEGLSGLWRSASHAARAWWRSHPAHVVVEVAEPVLGRVARKSPMKLLGAAAAVGAVVVFARPWRLISMTGLVVAALKSTQASSLLSSLIAPPEKRRPGDNED